MRGEKTQPQTLKPTPKEAAFVSNVGSLVEPLKLGVKRHRAWGLGLRVSGFMVLGFRIQGLNFRLESSRRKGHGSQHWFLDVSLCLCFRGDGLCAINEKSGSVQTQLSPCPSRTFESHMFAKVQTLETAPTSRWAVNTTIVGLH